MEGWAYRASGDGDISRNVGHGLVLLLRTLVGRRYGFGDCSHSAGSVDTWQQSERQCAASTPVVGETS
jgi:hypothetical protein